MTFMKISIILIEAIVVVTMGTVAAMFAWANVDEIKEILHRHTVKPFQPLPREDEEWYVLNKYSGAFIGASDSKEWSENLQKERKDSVMIEKKDVENYRKRILRSRWDHVTYPIPDDMEILTSSPEPEEND